MSVLPTSAFIILTPQEILSSLYLSLILQKGTQNAVCLPEPDFLRALVFGSQWKGHCQHNMNLVLLRATSSRWHCSANKPRLQSLWDDWNQLTQVLAGSLPSPAPAQLSDCHLRSTEKIHDYFWNTCFCPQFCRLQDLKPWQSLTSPPQWAELPARGRAEALGTRLCPMRVNIKQL